METDKDERNETAPDDPNGQGSLAEEFEKLLLRKDIEQKILRDLLNRLENKQGRKDVKSTGQTEEFNEKPENQ